MKSIFWIRTDRLWCLFFVLAVSQITKCSSKTIDQIKVPIPTKESLPLVAEELKAATYLEENDELEKNFEGQRNSYKRSPRKLETDSLDQNSELLTYQGVVGRPGVDFPILPSIPHTDFSCKKKPGYYADPETDCQVFHICDNGRKVSFLCPNGTVFRQSHLICDWWFRVDCERSVELYEESAEQLASDQRIFKERAEALAKAMLKVQTTQATNDHVVTERSFGPSTTVFNSESRLPDRARYFSSYSKDENQFPAESGSFAGNQFQTNFNGYYQQSKTPVKNWNQGNNIQSINSYVQPSTTIQPPWNQANNYNNYESTSYQSQSTTTANPSKTQEINNFQTGNQFTTNAQPIQNQGASSSQINYQPQSTTLAPQINWNHGIDNYQFGNYQSPSSTAATQINWSNQGNNGFKTDNYQAHTPSITQANFNQGSSNNYQSTNYQTPSMTVATINSWNNQGSNSFQTENYQSSTSTSTPTPLNWNNQNNNNLGTINYQKDVADSVTQPNWNQHHDNNNNNYNNYNNNQQSNNYQPQAATTILPEWNQEPDTIQPNFYNSQQPYQQPTTTFPPESEQTEPAKESQVPAESASFVGNQNSPRLNFQQENYYPQDSQTNPPPTTYTATSSYPNRFSPSGAFSFVDYQRSPNTPLTEDTPTQASPTATTSFDYTTVNNSTLPPSGETLIPNMINSLQTLSDNNLLFDLDGLNQYHSQTSSEDDLNSIALYFNNLKIPTSTAAANDIQYRSSTNGVSSVTSAPVEITSPAVVENVDISAVLTQNTKAAYDNLFKNDTTKEQMTSQTTGSDATTPGTLTSSANIGFAQGLYLNRSTAELRELAAVFTRALTAYLDDPENFRKILAEVRPTEPPIMKVSATEEQEVLDFSDDSKSRRNKPAESSSTITNLASDINEMTQPINTDLSTVIPQYTTSPMIDITAKYTGVSNTGLNEYSPPADSEQLQAAGSQSFYSSRDNSIETAKTPRPEVTSSISWSVSPWIDTEQDIRTTTLPPVYFTTTAENLETTVIVQRAKEMFNHLNASDAGVLMNAMQTDQANETVRRLVLLLVNDPNKEHSPEQTRNHIVEALLDNRADEAEDRSYGPRTASPSPTAPLPTPPPPPYIPFGQRLQEDGTPVPADGSGHKRPRKGTRRRVAVHKIRSAVTSTTAAESEAETTTAAVPTTTPGVASRSAGAPSPLELSSDSDARAVELLKSLYSIASKWS